MANNKIPAEHVIGKKFGTLTAVKEVDRVEYIRYFECICDCGRKAKVQMGNLRSGNSKKCRECNLNNIHKGRIRHGKSLTPIYRMWISMKGRCHNPTNHQFDRFGGRGIIVCERWHDFNNFMTDMGENYQKGMILSRMNINGNYDPANCKWMERSNVKYYRANNPSQKRIEIEEICQKIKTCKQCPSHL